MSLQGRSFNQLLAADYIPLALTFTSRQTSASLDWKQTEVDVQCQKTFSRAHRVLWSKLASHSDRTWGRDYYFLDAVWKTYKVVLAREFASLPCCHWGNPVNPLHAAQPPATLLGPPVAYPWAQQQLPSQDALLASIGLLAEAGWRLQPQRSSTCSFQPLRPCSRTEKPGKPQPLTLPTIAWCDGTFAANDFRLCDKRKSCKDLKRQRVSIRQMRSLCASSRVNILCNASMVMFGTVSMTAQKLSFTAEHCVSRGTF